jgi:predicted DNA-binding protein (MmcQ/YjbR family)
MSETSTNSSLWSLWSQDSVMSIGSRGSVLSIGSVGSALSVGSIGSFASVFCVASAGSLASALSFGSALSLMSARSFAAVMSYRSVRAVMSAPVAGRARRGNRHAHAARHEHLGDVRSHSPPRGRRAGTNVKLFLDLVYVFASGPRRPIRGLARLLPESGSMTSMRAEDAVARVRDICLALPGAAEQAFGGHTAPSFRVGGKLFVMTSEDLSAITFKAAPGVQEALVAGYPERFFVPRYVGRKGWLGARLDVSQDWQEIAELIEDSFRLIAPKRLVAQLGDQATGRTGGGPGEAP